MPLIALLSDFLIYSSWTITCKCNYKKFISRLQQAVSKYQNKSSQFLGGLKLSSPLFIFPASLNKLFPFKRIVQLLLFSINWQANPLPPLKLSLKQDYFCLFKKGRGWGGRGGGSLGWNKYFTWISITFMRVTQTNFLSVELHFLPSGKVPQLLDHCDSVIHSY